MASCSKCGKSKSEGQHQMSRSDAERFAPMHCQKCSTRIFPECVAESIGYYRCTCGTTWTEPLASF